MNLEVISDGISIKLGNQRQEEDWVYTKSSE